MVQRTGTKALVTAGACLALLIGTAGVADAAPRPERTGPHGGILVAIGYEHINFEGERYPFYADECRGNAAPQHQDVIEERWNDRISSIHTLKSCALIVYEHGALGGKWNRLPAVGAYASLPGFNDMISSVSFLRPQV
ncbi:hypothetical protein [Streptomyces clavuligerus]|uniref:Beta/gamma crystallin 'Greek key' domain-containing protein n=1 Tax=Streptomyces clavuligerus TaxID=1901 RepID=B5GSX9_STRCL|nr:hypothetical protein [Streptomyces clavuligerus]ANW18471.1 hypothetical protein BB341_09605 [Streptomyces clavuligerus]AXU13026.1 hypothetical protein D1794_09940 [Streptomyces clavuligerus]EDY49425.1 hypothetical protein SSCG_02453 [Streptomyces clavuligerus]EFG08893.1 Hypothetical protein SCLAV_3821 [Streptomyces clavuligerus]MBY6302959.1 hypothetical protein [Streptomyces clavuligerus]